MRITRTLLRKKSHHVRGSFGARWHYHHISAHVHTRSDLHALSHDGRADRGHPPRRAAAVLCQSFPQVQSTHISNA
uniref:Uncharacterized protein n=1 Tax=Anguilla anguilla TaxID=7936 RepID=A0A0E9V9Q1_ANGAN